MRFFCATYPGKHWQFIARVGLVVEDESVKGSSCGICMNCKETSTTITNAKTSNPAKNSFGIPAILALYSV